MVTRETESSCAKLRLDGSLSPERNLPSCNNTRIAWASCDWSEMSDDLLSEIERMAAFGLVLFIFQNLGILKSPVKPKQSRYEPSKYEIPTMSQTIRPLAETDRDRWEVACNRYFVLLIMDWRQRALFCSRCRLRSIVTRSLKRLELCSFTRL